MKNEDNLEIAVSMAKFWIGEHEPAMVVVIPAEEPVIVSELEYWYVDLERRSEMEKAFAERVHELGCDSVVIAIPLIANSKRVSEYRAPSSARPLDDDESEQIWAVSLSVSEGIDLARVLFTRRPNGEAVFDDIQVYNGKAELGESAPGCVLLKRLLEL